MPSAKGNKDNATYANDREGSSALMFRQDGSGGFTASGGNYKHRHTAQTAVGPLERNSYLY